jgi:hypothetical protein
MIKKYEIYLDDSNPTDCTIVSDDLLFHHITQTDGVAFNGLQCNHESNGTDTDVYARVLEMCNKQKEYAYLIKYFNDGSWLKEEEKNEIT